jgi:Fe2+ transport system protein B
MIKINEETKKLLLKIYEKNGIGLEGNILKIIDLSEEDEEFSEYIKTCKEEDKTKRSKRLDITKKVQSQNLELQKAKEEIERVNEELKKSLDETNKAKELVEYDLDILQKKNQYQLINTIVKVALVVIVGVGILTTFMYLVTMFTGKDTQIIASAWTNTISILLTNAFSIVGTIMGVKYLQEDNNKN